MHNTELLFLVCAGPPKGNLLGIDHDCNDIPDAAMTLAVAALFAQGQTRIRNVYNWRVKVILLLDFICGSVSSFFCRSTCM